MKSYESTSWWTVVIIAKVCCKCFIQLTVIVYLKCQCSKLVDLGKTITELESINYVVSNLLKLAVLQHIKSDVWEKKLVFFDQELKVFVGTKGGKWFT